MKKALGTAFVVALLLAAAAPATWAAAGMTFYPLDLSTVEVEMQQRQGVDEYSTVNVFGTSGKPRLGPEFDVNATALGAGIRYYVDGPGEGVYLGAYVGIYWLSGEYRGQETLARAVIFSATSGYKWALGGGFYLDAGARLTFPMSASKDGGQYNARQVLHDAFGTQLNIGFGVTLY